LKMIFISVFSPGLMACFPSTLSVQAQLVCTF